jgi:glutathione S-transferase
MYTLFLGTPSISSWSLRPYVAMRATGASFEKIFITLRQPDTKAEILKHSPSGKIPALKIEENGKISTVWDSLAICETLAERHPQTGLWPDDAAARAEARSISAEMHAGFPDVRDQLGLAFGETLPMPNLRDDTKKQVERIIALWRSALARYGKDGGYLFGRLSVADCMYAPVVSRFTTYGVDVPADVKAYMNRIWALPAMREWLGFAKTEKPVA